ncbi:MAG: ComF family protein [candidate division Zixibacteria bacterium]|nr:ComF family protein [candidate division Zixibacteria bacterium]
MERVKNTVWWQGLLDFVFPPLCLGCGVFNDGELDICEKCLAAIDRYQYPICLNCETVITGKAKCPACGEKSLPLFAFGNYRYPLKEIVIQFKFHGVTSPAKILADLINQQFGERIAALKTAALVPIPLFPSRENHRGYNQAVLFAEQLSKLLAISVRGDIIFRDRKRKPQAKLNLRQRSMNIKGVFSVIEPSEKLMRVILVDDVVTSGATVQEAARVLKAANYHVCAVISMAHGA